MSIRLNDFSGTTPVRSKRLLPDNAATLAENVKLKSGELRGLRAPLLDYTFPDERYPARIFRFKDPNTGAFTWASSNVPEAEIVKNPLVNDAFNRYYLFRPNKRPQVTTFTGLTPSDWNDLALPSPELPPNAQTNNAGEDTIAAIDRVYVISWVTEWGEESLASDPVTVTLEPGESVTLSSFYSGNTNLLEGRDWEYVRIYRSVSGRVSTDLYFVADIDWGLATYVDAEDDSVVVFNDLSPDQWDPPEEGIYGAKVHPSGSLVAFKGRDIHFSESYRPHAWPAKYKISVEDEIVAIEVIGQSILVMTKGSPVAVFGQNVASLGVSKFTSPMPCSNYNSVVAFSNLVYYTSPDGLVSISQNGPTIVSEAIIGREEFQRNIYSEDIFAVRSENDYVALKSDGTGFVFSIDMGKLALNTFAGFNPDPVFLRDKYEAQVWYCEGSNIYKWDPATDADEVTYRWRSKEFYMAKPTNMASVVLEFDKKPGQFTGNGAIDETGRFIGNIDYSRQVVFRVWADGNLICELVCSNKEQVNLPAGYEADVWQFEIEGQCRVHSAFIAESGKEQASG